MSNVSVRLPDEVVRHLTREAEISGRHRSDLMREAIGEYLLRRERNRFMAGMVKAAKALYSDPEARTEMQEIQSDFDAIDNAMESVEAEERMEGIESGEPWWQ